MKSKGKQSPDSDSTGVVRSGAIPADYRALLDNLKVRIRSAQVRAALSVNRELIQLYWDIGRAITVKQEAESWGTKVIERLASDLQREFPGIAGFSRANIYRMRAFYLAYRSPKPIVAQPARQIAGKTVPPPVGQPDNSLIVSQPARQLNTDAPPELIASLPWFHNVVLLENIKEPAARSWYAQQAVAHGWSRYMLEHWIESDLYARQGKAVTNFSATMPPAQSDLAQQIVKDPYSFDFLTLHAEAMERELEEGLLDHITRFLLELGEGFAFVGRQVHLEVDGEDFYIDLLFYHLHLRCFVVIDLKTGRFKPEYAGKMNFYLSAVDDQMRKPGDVPTIGLILCKTRSRVIAEYALRHLQRPVGVARYVTKLIERLPGELADKLPTVQQIERELSHTPAAGKSNPKKGRTKP
ncbi:MAG: PDDEXK nuclease domain-containing protein [Planctomycetes bacterium]|nr:PDDEXK nuclease domain-containing protein [Planctomycetota bacterium]